ncbi:class I SAM-dependent methyltransferase [Pseudoxanthomonas sacheonensis]|uniref:SAM-dependent methyltransferase n=1 Tax=Pseudoxanthomonas sacheonensis TaxID=443615 RepID=A0ABU1RY77_9GAMM|nr:class I SAM-dependent methyltransferase [Pseudoxanthomonas sacheonensis]MDR6843315.1 SAM-dependent methyltransferase [Pseudoxanthomonas sacheonensis]
MKNSEIWQPSKYTMRKGRLFPSRDTRELAPSSRLIAQLIVDAYQPALDKHTGGRLLDLGCGKVPFYEAYRAHVTDNVCVDWPGSPHSSLHIDTFCDLSQPLPFDDAQFDTILSSDVIEHLPDPVLAFREMGRLLKPNGKLILNTPFLYMLHEVPNDYYRHTRYSLQRLAALANMEVLELEEIGGFGEVFGDLIAKAINLIPGVGTPIAIAWQKMLIALSRTGIWQKARRASAPRFPLGYFMVARKLQPGKSAARTSHETETAAPHD